MLKGPQGTLYGENATGGAINYIANKPTDTFQAGGDFSCTATSATPSSTATSAARSWKAWDGRIVMIQTHNSGAWQKGYGPQSGQSIGGSDFLNGRISLLWKPNDRFKALLTVNGWQDKSYNQMGQLYGIAELSPKAPIDPAIVNYPLAPHNDQAAGWNQCVNTSPFDPIAGQENGAQYNTPVGIAAGNPASLPNHGLESEGPGSQVWAGGQPTHCTAPRNNNTYFSGTLRMDYDLGSDMVATSLTEFQKFNRTAGIDGSGMPIQDYQSYQRGKITSVYQEVRLAGKWAGKGTWLVGANYEYDHTWDSFLQTYNASTASPTFFAYNDSYYSELFAGSPAAGIVNSTDQAVGALFGFGLGPTKPSNEQKTTTYAVYANAEYPILDNLVLQGGVRFTQENKHGAVCGDDGGDGSWALIAYNLQSALGSTHPVLSPPGTCATVGFPSNNFNSPANGALIASDLNQSNVSWRVGLNYKLTPNNLFYVNVSKGYKGGSYPTVAMSTYTQAHPVTQEGLLAYEGGFKSTLLDHQLTINGAAFYYDYSDKQILGAIPDVLFGTLPALLNVPQSHVIGFEVSGTYTPEWLRGLTITPAVSYQHSNIDKSSKNTCDPVKDASKIGALASEGLSCVPGQFYNFDAYAQVADFTNEKFPSAPEWQASVDAEYDWKLRDDITAFVGINVQYTSATNTFFVNRTPLQPVFGYNLQGLPVGSPVRPAVGADSCGGVINANFNHPNDPNTVKAYTLVDLRGRDLARATGGSQIWGRNVTNEYYWDQRLARERRAAARYTGMPTTYGFTLSWKYH